MTLNNTERDENRLGGGRVQIPAFPKSARSAFTFNASCNGTSKYLGAGPANGQIMYVQTDSKRIKPMGVTRCADLIFYSKTGATLHE